MKLSIKLLFFCVAQAYGADRVIDETVVNEWGYQTISLDKHQLIKKKEAVKLGGKRYYPRFYISKECFPSPSEAIKKLSEIERLQKVDARHRDFDYRIGFEHDSCLFILDTNSQLFKLDYQPELFSLFKTYVTRNK